MYGMAVLEEWAVEAPYSEEVKAAKVDLEIYDRAPTR